MSATRITVPSFRFMRMRVAIAHRLVAVETRVVGWLRFPISFADGTELGIFEFL